MNDFFLTIPGIGNSGHDHWQSFWERTDKRFKRVEQQNWERPILSEWIATLEEAVKETPNAILVAHSLGNLLVAHWATMTTQKPRAAFLVAVPNPEGPAFPKEAAEFAPIPLQSLPFKSLVVASTNDPYGSPEFTSHWASVWGSRYVSLGARGHINASSKLGNWSEGRLLLESLIG